LWPASDKLQDHKIFSGGYPQNSPVDQDRFSTVNDTPFKRERAKADVDSNA
jgi:hypothetical protein